MTTNLRATGVWPPTDKAPWRGLDKRVTQFLGFFFATGERYHRTPFVKILGAQLILETASPTDKKSVKSYVVQNSEALLTIAQRKLALDALFPGRAIPEIKQYIEELERAASKPITLDPTLSAPAPNKDRPTSPDAAAEAEPNPAAPNPEEKGLPPGKKPDTTATKEPVTPDPTQKPDPTSPTQPDDTLKTETVAQPEIIQNEPPQVPSKNTPSASLRKRNITTAFAEALDDIGISTTEAPFFLAIRMNDRYGSGYTSPKEVHDAMTKDKIEDASHKWAGRFYMTPFNAGLLRTINRLRIESGFEPRGSSYFYKVDQEPTVGPLHFMGDKLWQNCLDIMEKGRFPAKRFDDITIEKGTPIRIFFANLKAAYRIEGGLPTPNIFLVRLAKALRTTTEDILPLQLWENVVTILTEKPAIKQTPLMHLPKAKRPNKTSAEDPESKGDAVVAEDIQTASEEKPHPSEKPETTDFQKVAIELLKAYLKLDEFEKAYVMFAGNKPDEEIDQAVRDKAIIAKDRLIEAQESYLSGRTALLAAAQASRAELTLRDIVGGLEIFEAERRRAYLERHLNGESDVTIASFMITPDPSLVKDARENLLAHITSKLSGGPKSTM